jgi:hypothetical protein
MFKTRLSRSRRRSAYHLHINICDDYTLSQLRGYATSPLLPVTCTLSLCEQRCQPWPELRCSSLLLCCCALPWWAAPARRGRWLASTSSRTRRGISPSRSPTGEPPSCLSSFRTPKVRFGFLASCQESFFRVTLVHMLMRISCCREPGRCRPWL